MSLKRWVLGKVHGTTSNGQRVAPSLRGTPTGDGDDRDPHVGALEERHGRAGIAHLGPYAPLIAAIREELEHFVESQLRLHLAIAERDRYVLTSIDVDCEEQSAEATLLRRFIAEFRPEQIKRYLARDVIAGLRNASSIDLSQFAGLNDPRAETASDQDDPYRDLLADLNKDAPGAKARGFAVALAGRWVQADTPMSESAPLRGRDRMPKAGVRHTPLAGGGLSLDIEDAGGARRFELPAVVPGRRYVVGKEDGCDIRVDGVYASRRHCELWLERDAWWVVDAGSTNGIRVETKDAVARGQPSAGDRLEPIEVPAGARLVLSALAEGEPRLYPCVTLHASAAPEAAATSTSDRPTIATPLAPSRVPRARLTLSAHTASGVRRADLAERALPFGVGRSRNQALTIDSAHTEVSGRHLEIVAIDEAGAWVVVHGDNGVTVEGAAHAAGEKFFWNRGETMLLGRENSNVAGCTLTLTRAE